VSRVLVVEDNPPERKVVEHALSREGVRTAGVGSGEEALERLRAAASSGEPFDLVVLDLVLPGALHINYKRLQEAVVCSEPTYHL